MANESVAAFISKGRLREPMIDWTLWKFIFAVPIGASLAFECLAHLSYRQSPVKGGAADVPQCGHILDAFASIDQLAGIRDLRRGQFLFPAKLHPSAAGLLHAGLRPFNDHAAFQLGKYADHLPHGAARWRSRVDGLSKGLEFHVAGAEVVEHCYQVAQAATQAVELPNCEHIAGAQRLEATEQGGALRSRS